MAHQSNSQTRQTSLNMRHLSLWTFGALLFVFAAGASSSHGAQTNALLINGSFEEGQDEPLGWSRNSPSTWTTGKAHRGQRFARVNAADRRGWEARAVAISPNADYRLEGWIRTAAG